MKKFAMLALAVSFTVSSSWASSNPFNQIPSYANASYLNPFAKDLGAVLGGGSFHTGQTLGFPGVDVGVQAAAVHSSGNDAIVNSAGLSYIGIPWIQGEIGLPFGFDAMVRGVSAYGATALGGGLSLGLLKSTAPLMPNLKVSGTYDQIDQTYFTAHTYSANAVLSFNVPIVEPYVGAGYDRTNLKIKDAAFAGTGINNPGIEGSATGYRLEGGINLHFLPFAYLTIAAGLANGDFAPHAGLGIRF